MKYNEFKHIKNCRCYYFDDISKSDYIDLDDILIVEKSREHILIYNIWHKTLSGPKHLRIKFNKIDRFIKIYDGTRHLTLFDSKKNMMLLTINIDIL